MNNNVSRRALAVTGVLCAVLPSLAAAQAPGDPFAGSRSDAVGPQAEGLRPRLYLNWTGKADAAVPAERSSGDARPPPPRPLLQAPPASTPTLTRLRWEPSGPKAPDAAGAPAGDAQAGSAASTSGRAAPQWRPGSPRFYSMHRDYGLEPDAIPLPPAFFAASADLSQPSTEPLFHKTTTAAGQTRIVETGASEGAAP